MDSAHTPSNRDYRWQSVFDNVPSDFLVSLARTRKGYKLENLTKGQETLVDEIFRICDAKTLDLLYAQFTGLEGPVWFYIPQSSITKQSILDSVRGELGINLQDGQTPAIGHTPQLYRYEIRSDAVLFYFAAKDSIQNIRTGLGERTSVEVLNLYTSVVHFSDPRLVIVGPYAGEKANAVAAALQATLQLNVPWESVKAKRGERRSFYDAVKAALKANLIETKRHDPSGDYETVALEARSKQPDLEDVPAFKKQYLDADSLYDVLQFEFANPLGIQETTHVKFGRPFGRFTFRARSSVAAIYHFEQVVYGILF